MYLDNNTKYQDKVSWYNDVSVFFPTPTDLQMTMKTGFKPADQIPQLAQIKLHKSAFEEKSN